MGKAGPDLFTVGDRFPRRELITAILEPSETIAVGYGATLLETKSGETLLGVVKQADATATVLMGADGRAVRVPAADIKAQSISPVSLIVWQSAHPARSPDKNNARPRSMLPSFRIAKSR